MTYGRLTSSPPLTDGVGAPTSALVNALAAGLEVAEATLATRTAAVASIARSGLYLQSPAYGGANFSNFTMTNGFCQYMPIFVERTLTVDRLALSVTTLGGAGSLVRLGLYADSSGGPGSLLVDAGTVDTTTTGDKLATVSQVLTPGRYWIAAASQGGATPQPIVVGGFNFITGWTNSLAAGTTGISGLQTNGGITGALASNPTVNGVIGGCPRLVARVV